jgi:hypothetical protein
MGKTLALTIVFAVACGLLGFQAAARRLGADERLMLRGGATPKWCKKERRCTDSAYGVGCTPVQGFTFCVECNNDSSVQNFECCFSDNDNHTCDETTNQGNPVCGLTWTGTKVMGQCPNGCPTISSLSCGYRVLDITGAGTCPDTLQGCPQG